MLKNFNHIINYIIVLTVLFLIIGMMLILFPEMSITAISYVLSISLIVLGVVLVIYSLDKLFFMDLFSFGLLQVVLGVVILVYPKILTTIIPIAIGVWMIVKSSVDFRLSLVLKKCRNKDWYYVTILSLLAMLCGIMLITNTEIGTITLTVVVGIFLCAYSLTAIVNTLIFKDNINDIAKELGIKSR